MNRRTEKQKNRTRTFEQNSGKRIREESIGEESQERFVKICIVLISLKNSVKPRKPLVVG